MCRQGRVHRRSNNAILVRAIRVFHHMLLQCLKRRLLPAGSLMNQVARAQLLIFLIVCVLLLRESEVHQVEHVLLALLPQADQDIRWLDVSVDVAAGVEAL